MFNPDFERKGKRHADDVVPKRFKSAPTDEQEYEEDIEGVWSSSSSSSSSTSYISPSSYTGKRSYEEYSGVPSWQAYPGKRHIEVVGADDVPAGEDDPPEGEIVVNNEVRPNRVALMRSLASGEEVKHIEHDDWDDEFLNSGFCYLLNGLNTGATAVTRNGNRVVFRSIQLRGMIYPDAEANKNTVNHIWIIYDTQPTGALPNINDFFEGSNGMSFIKYDSRYRFIPLVHRVFTLGMQSATMSDFCVCDVDIYKKLNRVTVYKGNTDDIADIAYGALYIVVIGISNANTSRMNYNMRILYTED